MATAVETVAGNCNEINGSSCETLKQCNKCHAFKLLSSFNRNKRKWDGLSPACRACDTNEQRRYKAVMAETNPVGFEAKKKKAKEYNKIYHAKNYKKTLSVKCRDRMLRSKYGISEQDYLHLLDYQNNACAICRRVFPFSKGSKASLSVDHDHQTGEIRGLLCQPCNAALGLMFESADTMRSAIAYLAEPPARSVVDSGYSFCGRNSRYKPTCR